MPAVELANAYVSIIPSAKGIGNKIAAEIGPPIEQAGRRAGDAAASSVAASFKDKMSSAGSTLSKIGAGATIGLTLPILAAGKAAIDSASSLNESLSKAKVVFGNFTGGIEALAATSATKLGQSRQSVLEAAGTFGNLFVALKIGQQPAAEMSARLVTLASDLASFNNVSPEDALVALRAGLVGETEPLRKFGVNLNDATLKAKALELGLSDGKATLTPAAKAQASYALILEQTSVAQGDFARTSEGAANKQRILAAQFANAKASLGQSLLPIFVQVATIVGQLTERFSTLSPTVQKVILAVAGVLAVAGPLVGAIGAIATVVTVVASPVGLIVGAIAALAAGLVYAYFHVESFRNIVDGVATTIADFVMPRIRLLVDLFQTRVIPAIVEAARVIGEAIKPKLDELAATFERNRPQIDAVVNAVGQFIDAGIRAGVAIGETVLPILARLAGFFGGVFIDQIRTVVNVVGALVRGFEDIVRIGDKVGSVLSRLPGVGGGGNSFHIPGFATGGTVPGPLGAPRLAVVHGGEQVLTRAQQFGGSGSGGSSVAINVAAPVGAGMARQIEYAARVAGWQLARTGRR